MLDTKYTLWDIDNCLADDRPRQHLIDWHLTGNARYDRYNAKMMEDELVHKVEFDFMCRFTTPVFLTGRVEKWENHTRHWLGEKLNVESPLLYMRADGDEGSPAAVKKYMLRGILARINLKQIVAGFDDVPAVVKMYQDCGISAAVLAIHTDLSKVYGPSDLAPLTA